MSYLTYYEIICSIASDSTPLGRTRRSKMNVVRKQVNIMYICTGTPTLGRYVGT